MRFAISSRPVVDRRSSSAASRSYASWVRNVTGASLDTCVSFGLARWGMPKRPGSGQGVSMLRPRQTTSPSSRSPNQWSPPRWWGSSRGTRVRAGRMPDTRRSSSPRCRGPHPALPARTRPCVLSGTEIWKASVTVRCILDREAGRVDVDVVQRARDGHPGEQSDDDRGARDDDADRPTPPRRARAAVALVEHVLCGHRGPSESVHRPRIGGRLGWILQAMRSRAERGHTCTTCPPPWRSPPRPRRFPSRPWTRPSSRPARSASS